MGCAWHVRATSSAEAPNSIAVTSSGDQRTGIRSDDVRAEQAIGRFVGQQFHEAIRLANRTRAAVRGERELADVVGYAGGFQFLLGLPDRSNLRPRIHDARDRSVVHMPCLAGEKFGQRNAFLFRLVRQHRSGDHIADRVDAGDVGRVMRVGLHPAALVQLDAGSASQPFGVRPPADRQQHDVGLQLLRRTALRRFDGQRHAVVALARAGHLHAETELHALARQDAFERLGDLGVHRGHDTVEELHHRHLAPSRRQTLPSSRPI